MVLTMTHVLPGSNDTDTNNYTGTQIDTGTNNSSNNDTCTNWY